MAAVIEIVGPHTVSWGGNLLGRGDNDDLFSIDVDYKRLDVKTNQSADMPMDFVNLGAIVTVAFSCIVIDRTALLLKLSTADGLASGNANAFPKVGVLLSATVNSIANAGFGDIVLDYGSTGKITVPRCRLMKWTSSDHGNKPTRFKFAFEASANPASTVAFDTSIYTLSGTP